VILVDSSVWIDFLSVSPGPAGTELRRLIEEAEPVAVAGVVVTEVLQGLSRDAGIMERYLSQFEMLEPTGFETYKAAAAMYRSARAKGITLTTIDTLIASIALENAANLFTLDQDFDRVARITRLALYRY
jgi:predicted nucleic acid-binding protein